MWSGKAASWSIHLHSGPGFRGDWEVEKIWMSFRWESYNLREKKIPWGKKKIQSWVSWIFWLPIKHQGLGQAEPSSSIDCAAEWRLSPGSCTSLISWGWCSTAKALAHQAHNTSSHTKCSPSRKAHGFLPFWANYLLFQWNLLALSSS